MELDDVMERARVSGDETAFDMAADAVKVTIIADDLSEEWMLAFVDDQEVTRYAHVDFNLDPADIVDWLEEQGVSRKSVRVQY